MRERYERELEHARRNHAERRLELSDRLSREHRILCIDTSGGSIMNSDAWKGLHPEQKQLYHESMAGGSERPLFAEWFRYAMGYDEGDQRFEIWDARGGDPRPETDVEKYDAVLMTGSSAMVTTMREDPNSAEAEWMRNVDDVLRVIREHDIPTLGVCFGHQKILAHAGGEVGWMQDAQGKKMREVGPSKLELTDAGKDDPLLQGAGDEIWVQSSHEQHVTALPEGIVVLAHNPVSAVQAIRYVDRMMWSIQNHPKVNGITMDIIITMRSKIIEAELAALSPEAKQALGFSTISGLRERIVEQDTHQAREIIFSNFLKILGENMKSKSQ